MRQAATAFMVMRERLQRQVSQRMDMLAGVSHDLRTPLTRMKLQLAMLEEADGGDELREDVAEMERMLDGYLAFARGEGDEAPRPTNLSKLLNEVVGQARRQGSAIDLHIEGEITASVRPQRVQAVRRQPDRQRRPATPSTFRSGWDAAATPSR